MKSKSSKKKERTNCFSCSFSIFGCCCCFYRFSFNCLQLQTRQSIWCWYHTILLIVLPVFYNEKISCIHYSNKRFALHLAKQKMKKENKTAHKPKKDFTINNYLPSHTLFILLILRSLFFQSKEKKEEKDIQRKLEITEITAWARSFLLLWGIFSFSCFFQVHYTSRE